MRANLGLPGACALLAAAVLAGCGAQQSHGRVPTPAQAARALAGAPAPLAALHRQADTLLGGGKGAFERELAALRGRPVVVNGWASWCGPCQAEIAYFQRSSVAFGKRVAFLGVAVDDTPSSSRGFLREHWTSYPSYSDQGKQIADSIGIHLGLPTTVFYGPDGKVYIHQGQYRSAAQLTADIARYALHA
jgi:cytochrome c biogenesis protein CcmG, thiol:disulfide interchange protein DsbE